MLDAAERAHWDRHGWLWLRGFLTPAEASWLQAWTDEVAGWPETPGTWMRYYERNGASGEKMLARIENFVPYHGGLAALFASPRFLDLLGECAGEPVVLFKDKINFKLPGGGGFAPHQDAPAYVNFGVEHHVTLMVPIDPFTSDNGCLVMALDTHPRSFLPHNSDGTMRADEAAKLRTEPLLATPGDVIVFDSWVPHWSGPNRTAGSRRSFYLTYNPASAGDHRAAYYARKRESFPPEYERRHGVDYATVGKQFNLGNPFD
jgi:hypothetical protein